MTRARTFLTLLLTGLGVLAAALAFAGTPAFASERWSITGSFGGEASTPADPEPLMDPAWVAVNQTTGDVYVVDQAADRVEYFTAAGEYEGQFNASAAPTGAFSSPGAIAIDNSGDAADPSKEDVYVVDTGHQVIDKFSPAGVYLGQLTATCQTPAEAPPCKDSATIPFSNIEGVTVAPDGQLWVLGGSLEGGLLRGFSDAAVNAPVGVLALGPGVLYLAGTFAVDAEGDFYVIARGGVAQLDAEGTKLGELVGFKETGTPAGLAVLPDNDVYVDGGSSITLAAPIPAAPVETFGVGPLSAGGGIAVNPVDGRVYVAEPANSRVFVLERASSPVSPPPPPATEKATEVTSISWTLHGKLNPAGVTGGVGYYFSYNAGAGSGCTGPGSSITPFDSGGANVTGSSAVAVSATVKLRPREEYSYCLLADKYGASAGPQLTLTTGAAKPEIIAGSEAATSTERKRLQVTAAINPESEETHYYVEYSETGVNGKEELEGEVETVAGESPLPAEYGGQPVSVTFKGAEAVTSFYYRVVAVNATGTTDGKVQVYTKLPVLTGEKASAVTSTSTRLEASVDPDFFRTSYSFEYADSREALEKDEGTIPPGGSGELEESSEPLPISVEPSGLQPGQSYYYRVSVTNPVTSYPANANKGAPVTGEILQVTTYPAPAPTTGAATAITTTTAVLSGEVNPEGAESTYYFAYITQAGYEHALAGDPEEKANPYADGETTSPLPVPSTGSETKLITPVVAAGLLPGITYHYTLVASNKYGAQATGVDQTFTTLPATLPTVTTGAANTISQNTATLSGTVATNGLQTNYGFEIGTEPNNYGPATGLGSIGGSQTEEVEVTLGELQPGTTYYYRVTATNADGTVQGAPQSFTTPGFPTLLSTPSSPPLIATPSIAFPTETGTTITTTTTTKTLTKAEKFRKALNTCKRDKRKSKRIACEKQARRRYGGAKARFQ